MPVGSRPELALSLAPVSLEVFAWTPDFESVVTSEPGRIEVSFGEPVRPNRVDLAVEPAARQELPLQALPVGEYALEVWGEWPDGTASFAFRVRIVSPDGRK